MLPLAIAPSIPVFSFNKELGIDMAGSAGVHGGRSRTVVDPSSTPGFRFYPTEEELLGFYLRHRLAGTRLVDLHRVIPVVDVYAHHPSDLPSMAGTASPCDTEQWFFFCPRAEREAHGGRPARTTPSGYWKATGSPSFVFSSSSSPAGGSSSSSRVIGVRRTMVFYQGRAPTGAKTRWKMNEYKAIADDDSFAATATATDQPTASVQLRNELSVCRVYISTGTVRSFDRRPLNPPGRHNQAAAPPPSSAMTTAPPSINSINTIILTGTGQKTDDASFSWSHGIINPVHDDASEDASGVDWNSLVATADVFSFGVDGFVQSQHGGHKFDAN